MSTLVWLFGIDFTCSEKKWASGDNILERFEQLKKREWGGKYVTPL